MKIISYARNHKLLVALALANCFIAFSLVSRWLKLRSERNTQAQVMVEKNADLLDKNGVMPRDQYLRINQIARSAQNNGGKISDADLQYCLAILNHTYTTRDEYRKRHNEKMLLGMLLVHEVTAPTPAQRDALYDEFKRSTASMTDLPKNSDAFQTTANILARSHDQRIAPVLVSMLNSPDHTFQQNCGTWLREIDYKPSLGTSDAPRDAAGQHGTM